MGLKNYREMLGRACVDSKFLFSLLLLICKLLTSSEVHGWLSILVPSFSFLPLLFYKETRLERADRDLKLLVFVIAKGEKGKGWTV